MSRHVHFILVVHTALINVATEIWRNVMRKQIYCTWQAVAAGASLAPDQCVGGFLGYIETYTSSTQIDGQQKTGYRERAVL